MSLSGNYFYGINFDRYALIIVPPILEESDLRTASYGQMTPGKVIVPNNLACHFCPMTPVFPSICICNEKTISLVQAHCGKSLCANKIFFPLNEYQLQIPKLDRSNHVRDELSLVMTLRYDLRVALVVQRTYLSPLSFKLFPHQSLTSRVLFHVVAHL